MKIDNTFNNSLPYKPWENLGGFGRQRLFSLHLKPLIALSNVL